MARSTNVLLACVAMLAAMLLAVVMTPHKLMARTHDVFDIDKHLPTAFGDWKAVEGLNVIAPAPADSLEREVYNQEASRGFVDPDGNIVMLMVAYGESQSDRLQLHHPEVCYTAQGFRVSATSSGRLAYSSSAPQLQYGVRGWIPDGALFRVSPIGVPPGESFKIQDKFIHDLLNSVDPATREFMVGDPGK